MGNRTLQGIEALQRAIVELAGRAIQLTQPNAAAEFTQMLAANDDPLRLVYVLGSLLSLDLSNVMIAGQHL